MTTKGESGYNVKLMNVITLQIVRRIPVCKVGENCMRLSTSVWTILSCNNSYFNIDNGSYDCLYRTVVTVCDEHYNDCEISDLPDKSSAKMPSYKSPGV